MAFRQNKCKAEFLWGADTQFIDCAFKYFIAFYTKPQTKLQIDAQIFYHIYSIHTHPFRLAVIQWTVPEF